MTCYACGKQGHMARNCREKNQVPRAQFNMMQRKDDVGRGTNEEPSTNDWEVMSSGEMTPPEWESPPKSEETPLVPMGLCLKTKEELLEKAGKIRDEITILEEGEVTPFVQTRIDQLAARGRYIVNNLKEPLLIRELPTQPKKLIGLYDRASSVEERIHDLRDQEVTNALVKGLVWTNSEIARLTLIWYQTVKEIKETQERDQLKAREERLIGMMSRRVPYNIEKEQRNGHGSLHWRFCYDDACATHLSSKQNAGFWPSAPRGKVHPCPEDIKEEIQIDEKDRPCSDNKENYPPAFSDEEEQDESAECSDTEEESSDNEENDISDSDDGSNPEVLHFTVDAPQPMMKMIMYMAKNFEYIFPSWEERDTSIQPS